MIKWISGFGGRVKIATRTVPPLKALEIDPPPLSSDSVAKAALRGSRLPAVAGPIVRLPVAAIPKQSHVTLMSNLMIDHGRWLGTSASAAIISG